MGFPERHYKSFNFYTGISSNAESLAEMQLDRACLTIADIGKAVYKDTRTAGKFF